MQISGLYLGLLIYTNTANFSERIAYLHKLLAIKARNLGLRHSHSHQPCQCVSFIHEWRNLEFNIIFEQRIRNI